jgi:hypothetical protein
VEFVMMVALVTDPVIMDVILVQKVLTNTSHVTSCIVMLKDVIKVSLLQNGQNDRIKNIVSVFYGIQCSFTCARVEQHPTCLYPTIDWFYASEMRSCR